MTPAQYRALSTASISPKSGRRGHYEGKPSADLKLGPDLERLAPLVSQRDGLQPRLLA